MSTTNCPVEHAEMIHDAMSIQGPNCPYCGKEIAGKWEGPDEFGPMEFNLDDPWAVETLQDGSYIHSSCVSIAAAHSLADQDRKSLAKVYRLLRDLENEMDSGFMERVGKAFPFIELGAMGDAAYKMMDQVAPGCDAEPEWIEQALALPDAPDPYEGLTGMARVAAYVADQRKAWDAGSDLAAIAGGAR